MHASRSNLAGPHDKAGRMADKREDFDIWSLKQEAPKGPKKHMTPPTRLTHPQFIRVLRRAGYSQELIQEIAAQLEDPIDTERDAHILARYGVTRGHLMDLMGAGP